MRLSRAEFLSHIKAKCVDLPPIKKRSRGLVASGASSLVLRDGHHKVLLATTHASAQNVQDTVDLIRKLREEKIIEAAPQSLLLPELVGVDQDVGALLEPDDAKKGLSQLKKNHMLSLSDSPIKNNVVFQMPMMDGNLESLLSKRFKQDTIDAVKKCLTESLNYLHDIGITHNDIAFRNILYKGVYPNIEIKLTDFGACTLNVEHTDDKEKLNRHHVKVANDLKAMNHLIKQMEEKLKRKPATPEKKPPSPRKSLPRRGASLGFYVKMQQSKEDVYGYPLNDEELDYTLDLKVGSQKNKTKAKPKRGLKM